MVATREQSASGSGERDALEALYHKLGRELMQSERSCRVHARREAKRQGPGPAADAMLALAMHADRCEPRLEELIGKPSIGIAAARVVAYTFSNVRHGFTDRLLAHERTYRATLLGVRHGLECSYLLSQVAKQADMRGMHGYLQTMLPERAALLDAARDALGWFAQHPRHASEHS